MTWTTALGVTVVIGLVAGCVHAPTQNPAPAATRIGASAIRFEAASVDGAPDVDTLARGKGYTLHLAGGRATLSMQRPGATDEQSVRMTVVGAQSVPVRYERKLPGTTNYLIGDRSTWRTGVSGFAHVRYPDVLPGIDLVFYGNEGQLEYDFVVDAGVDPSAIELRFDGADTLRLDGGDLVLTLGSGEIRQRRPVAYQTLPDGQRRDVESSYALDGTSVRFAIGPYDQTQPLVIDPVLTYATYLGGFLNEVPAEIRVDAEGAMYVYGTSRATNYPTEKARQPFLDGASDIVISKLSADGSTLIYSTYFGGNSTDESGSMTIDAAGNVYFLVASFSTNFPTVAGGYGVSSCPSGCPGDGIWVVKLDTTGTQVLYTAHIFGVEASGGSFNFPSGIALDDQNRAVVGISTYENAPIVNAVQPTRGSDSDGYVFKLNETGTQLVFGTYLGGNGFDGATAVDTDAAGNAYVVGSTGSSNFPVMNAIRPSLGGTSDVFITVFAPTGLLVRSTYFGGSAIDGGWDLDVLPDGRLVITGSTNSTDFPVRNASQPVPGGGFDKFVTRFESNFDLGFSTYIGTTIDEFESPYVAFDPNGNVHFLTTATSGGLPLAFHVQTYTGTNNDLYYAKFRATGVLLHATYLGGSTFERARSIVADASGQAFILGESLSSDAPTVNAFQPNQGGGFSFDLYIARLATAAEIRGVSPGAVAPGSSSRVRITGANFFGDTRVFVSGQPASGVVVESLTSMSVLVPARPPGSYDVAVVNPFGELAILPNGLLYGTCQFALATSERTVLGSGATQSVAVQTNAPSCEWTAQTDASWIVVNTPSAVGSTAARLTVSANLERTRRIATVTIAGRTLTVDQAPSSVMDLNGDARLDLLWHHQGDGRVATWLMNGTNNTNGTLLDPPQEADASWKLVGAGDLGGLDAQADLVWQNITSGALRVWFMNGLTSSDQQPLGPGPVTDAGWRIRSVGDWDGDGMADLVWHHQTDGRIALWLMNGMTQRAGTLFSPAAVPDVGWKVAGSGDFNRDGHRDLLWQHDDGRLAVWLMNGLTRIAGLPLIPSAVSDTNWKVRGAGDVNSDGHVNLIWQHQVSGDLSTWLMNGLRMVAGLSLNPATVGDTNWHIVGPR